MFYYLTAGGCLFLLAMIPVWTARLENPTYPFIVLILLGVLVVAVPAMFREKRPKRRKGDWLG